jgi:DNA-binding CsgD family transcriptional regulator
MLSEADLRGVERVAADVAEAHDVRTYAEAAVLGLLHLLPTDASHAYTELRQEPFTQGPSFESPVSEERPELDEAMAHFWRQSPTSSVNVGSGFGLHRWSDLIARDALERLEIYQEAFHPRGEDHVVKIAFPSEPLESHAFMLRRTVCDFDDREMMMLRLLAPSLRSARDALRARATANALEETLTAEGIGVIQLRRGSAGIECLGGAARILREWFQAGDASLPPAIDDWVGSQLRSRPLDRAESLVLRRADGTLIVRLVRETVEGEPDRLVLQHRSANGGDGIARSLGLTPREIEVLEGVARGMTNREVAQTLYLAPTTVRRHLENIFAKLGTRTRTAAVASAFPNGVDVDM